MFENATIYPDGSMRIDGFTPQKWRLMGINSRLAVIHSPGGNWSDNGGTHYGPASIHVEEIEELRPGNEPGTWRVKFKRLGRSIQFHPTPKVAASEAMTNLEHYGENYMRVIEERKGGA